MDVLFLVINGHPELLKKYYSAEDAKIFYFVIIKIFISSTLFYLVEFVDYMLN